MEKIELSNNWIWTHELNTLLHPLSHRPVDN